MRTSIGGADATGSGTALASSVNGVNVAQRAFDNDAATFWQSTSVAQSLWIGYDFGSGSPRDIVEIAWTAHNTSLTQNPVEWWLEHSDDNLTWVALAYDNFLSAWTSGPTRTMNTTVGRVEVASDTVVGHSAQNPNVRVNVFTPVGHSAQNPNARINGVWAQVHTSLDTSTFALVNGMYAVLHTSLSELPVYTLPILPDFPVVEKLSWLTDVIQNYDGSDQRIAARYKPRREFSYSLQLLSEDDYKKIYDVYSVSAGRAMYAPCWGYTATVKANAEQGQTTIYCNTFRGDFRKDDPCLITLRDGQQEVITIQDVFDDRIVLGRPLRFNVPKGSLLTPAPRAWISGMASLEMSSVSGSSSLTARIERPRNQEAWPQRPVTLPMFDGHVIWNERPDNNGSGFTFDRSLEVIDNQTGIEKYVTSWDQTYVEGQREYLVNTIWDWDKLQRWRTLFDYLCGRQRPFLTPTFLNDQDCLALTTTTMKVAGMSYFNIYKDSNTYQRFQIETDAGTANVKVSAVSNDGTDTLITFTNAISAAISNAEVKRASYLNLVRLASDSVTITHTNNFALIGLALRTAVE